jgi:hypothetical protein
MTFALAGVAGNPIFLGIFKLINALSKKLFGRDLEKDLIRANWYRGLLGKLGVDISGSVAIHLPTRPLDLLGRFGETLFQVGALGVKKIKGHGTIMEERKLKRMAFPAQALRIMDAIDIFETGEYVTPIAKTPISITGPPWLVAVKRAFGILPPDVAKTFIEEDINLKTKKRFKSVSRDLTERWSTAVSEENPKKQERIFFLVSKRLTDAANKLEKARTNDELMDALTELLFYRDWIEQHQKFKNALIRKYLPRQIEKKRRLPKYMKPEAVGAGVQ